MFLKDIEEVQKQKIVVGNYSHVQAWLDAKANVPLSQRRRPRVEWDLWACGEVMPFATLEEPGKVKAKGGAAETLLKYYGPEGMNLGLVEVHDGNREVLVARLREYAAAHGGKVELPDVADAEHQQSGDLLLGQAPPRSTPPAGEAGMDDAYRDNGHIVQFRRGRGALAG